MDKRLKADDFGQTSAKHFVIFFINHLIIYLQQKMNPQNKSFGRGVGRRGQQHDERR